jgi:CIC family chloride channel protein
MFLVRQAAEVMDRDVLVLDAATPLDRFLRDVPEGTALKHIAVCRGERICGVLRINTGLRKGLAGAHTGLTLGDVAQTNFTIARSEDTVFDVITRLWRKGGAMAIVVRGATRPRADAVVGMITKEHIADSVAESIKPYA